MNLLNQVLELSSKDRKKWLKSEAIKDIINSKAYKKLTTPIILKSGIESFEYIDLRAELLDFSTALREILSKLLEQELSEFCEKNNVNFEEIVPAFSGAGGNAIGVSLSERMKLRSILDRGKPKEHGSGKTLEGKLLENSGKTIIFDDVLSAGTSVKITINNLRANGIEPVAIFIIVDRSEETTGEQIYEIEGIPVIPLLKLSEIKNKE